MKITDITAVDLYEMSNIDGSITGLRHEVFCSQKGGAQHECRVKVSNRTGKNGYPDTFSIDLKDFTIRGDCRISSDDLEAVKWWIHRNRFAILDFWKDRINTREFFNQLTGLNENFDDECSSDK